MKPSPELFEFVKAREGCKLQAYRDAGGKLTIGIGHLCGPEVREGCTITEAQAREYFFQDIQTAVNCLNACIRVPVSQHQFDALVDFTFNVGCKAASNSTLLRKLNQLDYAGADAEFVRWDKCDGHILRGLTFRRQAESQLFNS